MRFLPYCVLAATMLAGCTPLPGGGQAANDPPPDGIWRGSSTRVQVESRRCPHPRLMTINVTDRGFLYPWLPGNDVAVTIAPDGTLAGQAGEVSITGKYASGRITGDASTPGCGLHFSLTRQS